MNLVVTGQEENIPTTTLVLLPKEKLWLFDETDTEIVTTMKTV